MNLTYPVVYLDFQVSSQQCFFAVSFPQPLPSQGLHWCRFRHKHCCPGPPAFLLHTASHFLTFCFSSLHRQAQPRLLLPAFHHQQLSWLLLLWKWNRHTVFHWFQVFTIGIRQFCALQAPTTTSVVATLTMRRIYHIIHCIAHTVRCCTKSSSVLTPWAVLYPQSVRIIRGGFISKNVYYQVVGRGRGCQSPERERLLRAEDTTGGGWESVG